MGRFLIFFAVAFVLSRVLAHVPLIGGFFARTGIFGIWIAAILLSFGMTWWGRRAVQVGRTRSELRRLLQVDTPHNRGKAGALLAAQGNRRAALEHLEAAAAGEPDVPEWHYRLGRTLLELRRSEEAVTSLERAVALDPEHAYGAAQLRLAEAREAEGSDEAALEALRTFERNHGPSPESCYRRGRLLTAAGRGDEARAAFDEVARLAERATKYQRKEAMGWALKAKLARLGR